MRLWYSRRASLRSSLLRGPLEPSSSLSPPSSSSEGRDTGSLARGAEGRLDDLDLECDEWIDEPPTVIREAEDLEPSSLCRRWCDEPCPEEEWGAAAVALWPWGTPWDVAGMAWGMPCSMCWGGAQPLACPWSPPMPCCMPWGCIWYLAIAWLIWLKRLGGLPWSIAWACCWWSWLAGETFGWCWCWTCCCGYGWAGAPPSMPGCM
mmetsp:Transcript_3734/g.9411  ORF Transcript_3734/g.9411 Transcript_3734/m.9411 type:complete len:206 (-) Transcript_3734:394-1011(-)